MKSVYLASGSPRRFELLQQLGLMPEKILATIDETPYDGESALAYTERMAKEKSAQAIQNNPNLHHHIPVLSADTTVALNDYIMGKPTDKNDAFDMLKKLSNTTHQVISSVCIFHQGQHFFATQISDVSFRELNDHEILRYIETGEPMDKAGAYGIQGLAATFVRHLNGSYTGVMGLPLYETTQLLAQCGIDPLQS